MKSKKKIKWNPSKPVHVGDIVQEMSASSRIGLVIQVELDKSMGYSMQTEEPMYFDHARIMWFGKSDIPSCWRVFAELRVLSAGNQKPN